MRFAAAADALLGPACGGSESRSAGSGEDLEEEHGSEKTDEPEPRSGDAAGNSTAAGSNMKSGAVAPKRGWSAGGMAEGEERDAGTGRAGVK